MFHHKPFIAIRAKFFHVLISVNLSLLFQQGASGQQLVNATGNTITDNNISIEYAIGEIAITTLSSGDVFVTQGLLQPIIKIDGGDPCKMLDLIPNAFTPNNDGLNDCYGLKQWPYASSFEMSIFNRWGGLIFKTTDMFACWDGKFKGKDQPVGVYVYMIRATTSCGPVFKKGTFALIR
ncbi:MAG: gliding motility-associated C-terminal domain-containing protein [Bacteroidota bacterium]|nr:gliding motility-associated C-terminal domain-containing protein [Bacteroidota bacterium]